MVAPRWDADGEPSSLDVLVLWLASPGNLARWQRKMEPQTLLVDEIFRSLENYGITYRSRPGINYKMWALMQQLNEAHSILRRCGVHDINTNKSVELKVLRVCPWYQALPPTTIPAWDGPSKELEMKMEKTLIGHSNAVKEMEPKPHQVGSKRKVFSEPNKTGTKQNKRREPNEGCFENDIQRVALLEVGDKELREYFQLEVQVKRDVAICVRAKARKELLDLGVARKDVDRLMPL